MSTHRFLRRVNTGNYSHDEFEVVTNTEVDGPDAKPLAIQHVKDMMALAYGEKECATSENMPVASLAPTVPSATVGLTETAAPIVQPPAPTFVPPNFGSATATTVASAPTTAIAPTVAATSVPTDITDEMLLAHGRQHALRIDQTRPGRGIVSVNVVTLKYVCRPLGPTTIGVTAPDGTAVPSEQKNAIRQQWMDEVAAL